MPGSWVMECNDLDLSLCVLTFFLPLSILLVHTLYILFFFSVIRG